MRRLGSVHGCEDLATPNRGRDLVRSGVAEDGQQQLIVDDDQRDGLLDSQIGIGLGNRGQGPPVAAVTLPVGQDRTGLIGEHRLNRPDVR